MLAQSAEWQRAVFENAVVELADVEGIAKALLGLLPQREDFEAARVVGRKLARPDGDAVDEILRRLRRDWYRLEWSGGQSVHVAKNSFMATPPRPHQPRGVHKWLTLASPIAAAAKLPLPP